MNQRYCLSLLFLKAADGMTKPDISALFGRRAHAAFDQATNPNRSTLPVQPILRTMTEFWLR